MPSNAFSGVGTQFLRGDTDSSSTGYTAIAEVNSITGPTKTRAFIDVTSLDSTGGYREFITSFRDAGEVTLEMNFTRDGYVLINSDFESEGSQPFRIILPDTGNTQLDFDAYVTDISMAIPLDDKVTSSVTLKVTGLVTLTS